MIAGTGLIRADCPADRADCPVDLADCPADRADCPVDLADTFRVFGVFAVSTITPADKTYYFQIGAVSSYGYYFDF